MIPVHLSTVMNIIRRQTTLQLAEFVSSMIYCMWHARKNVVVSPFLWQSTIKPYGDHYYYYHYYSQCYTASPVTFKNFCHQVLTITQLKESTVYLSLKYIAILLKTNPSIEGAEGSEYRLFIVALMLANKFLDDNTFKNKTWSDVSGMKVYDLNIMEAELLEALDYNLFIHEHDFNIWKQLLEECRGRMMHYHSNPQQVTIYTLKILGVYQLDTSTRSSWDPLTYSTCIYTKPILSWGNIY